MPNLINTDSAGNVFLNYITPVIKGTSIDIVNNDTIYNNFFAEKLGASGTNWSGASSTFAVRFPGSGLEMKTGNITTNTDGDARCYIVSRFSRSAINTNNTNTSTANLIGSTSSGGLNLFSAPYAFAVINDYAYCRAYFADAALTTLRNFMYCGWLREPTYTGTTDGVLGLTLISWDSTNGFLYGSRPLAPNSTTGVTLSTAADAITSPSIVCTAGTDPGDGSETFTDIVIRDAASPNNPVGKLWNCIDMPATCNVGELWRNTGAYDGDASASEQDIYLCVMPWGTRKLGMRVWTENIT